MLMPSSPPPLCKCLTFFFLVPFSHLARSKCCKLALLVKMCFLHLLSLSLLLFLHLLLSALLFPAALVYRSIYSHAILSAIFLTVCSPPLPCHPPSLPLSLSVSPTLAGWLIHFIVCSPQVYPRKSTPAVDRLCVGVPAAEVSQMLLNNASTFFKPIVSLLPSILEELLAFHHLVYKHYSPIPLLLIKPSGY